MALRRKCKLDLHHLISYITSWEEASNESIHISLLEIKRDELDKRWSKLTESYDNYMLEEDKGVTEDFKDDISIRYEEANIKYDQIKSLIINMIKEQNENSNQERSYNRGSRFRLPPCDMQNFDGGVSKWPAFRDMFQAVCANKTDMAPAEKLFYLRSKLRGEAFQTIKHLDLVDENYSIAWEALKNRYENVRVLVHQQMKQLYGMPTIPQENAKAMRHMQSLVNDSISILKSFSVDVANCHPFLVYLCYSKLPDETVRAWETSLANHKILPTWQQMSEFLTSRIEMLEAIQNLRKPVAKDNQVQKSHAFYSQSNAEMSKFSCKKCKQNHGLKFCNYFKSLSVKDRIKYVYNNKYCANCLSPNHFKSKCQSLFSCLKCNRKHHTMLHLEKSDKSKTDLAPSLNSTNQVEDQMPSVSNTQNSSKITPTTTTSVTPTDSVQAHFSQHEGTTILPTALIQIEHLDEKFNVRALLDPGSEKSFISKRIQQNLSLPLEAHSTKISGLGETVVGNSKTRCNVILRSRISNFKIQIKAIVLSKLTHFLPSRAISIPNLETIGNLKLADPFYNKPAPIDLIIGSNYLPFINLEGVKFFNGNSIEARESHFGWYLSGPEITNEVNTFSTFVSPINESLLNDQIRKFWELEEAEKNVVQSESDLFCENFFQQTTTRQPDGRYMVRLPFKKDFPADVFLGHSRNMALAQYYRMEKTLDKMPELKKQYTEVLQEYLDLDHMEEVVHSESKEEKQFSFFLPHHAVIKPESSTTKVRVVFNASKKTKSGFSLNDVLHQGPTLQTDLMQIILRWRNYKYVFTGDIEKMYRQILVHENDRPYQRIVFRKKREEDISDFQLKTITFGLNCAPFLALRTLLELSKDCENLYPKASKILKNEIYVDDILSGGHTLEEAKYKQDELSKALESARFPMKKVTANHKFLLEKLPREDLLNEDFLRFYDSSTTKTLGIRWNAISDTFYYVVEPIESAAITTKRRILSVIARLFDPLGWLGPVVVIAKLLMQELWEEKCDWDEKVSALIQIKWNAFVKNLPYISTVTLPRWVHFSPNHRIQIHGFCDASEKAYCGTIYIRSESETSNLNSHLLVAKTKVSPLKKITIPKLELCGALLLTKLLRNLVLNSEFQYELFLWTDSSIVLGWLQKPPNTLKTFVANRTTQILSITESTDWKHVRTEDNPADLGTRGCTPQELSESQLWWNGPPWLKQPSTLWPTPRTFDPVDLETKKCISFHMKCNPQSTQFEEIKMNDILENFSSLDRALRVICYIYRFINRTRKHSSSTEKFITAAEISQIKTRLMFLAQQHHFYKEYESLKEKDPLRRKSRLLTLSPFIDKDNLLRVGGRLENSGLSYEERHPIIIPEKSQFAVLLVSYTHRILLHSEHHIMLRAIRQGFYIPRLKNLIRKCIRNCKACTVYKHKFQNQMMASLPPERVNFSLPFTYTGVDFAGPFSIKSSQLRNAKILKGYAAVFVCFSTRAVHLEVCSDLSTDAFLACFDRFIGRRGLPKTMFSDNGRNFLGASYALLKSHNDFLKSTESAITKKHATSGFTWSFIPPYAPHMGGLWEAAVKSMKSHLKKVTNNMSFTYEEFSTLLVRIEAVLNSRPLSPLTENPNEILPLTPGHLLRGAAITSRPEAPAEHQLEDVSFLKRWERLKILQHVFARRWKNEYVTELQRRLKWQREKENLKKDDIVIVKDELLPPTEWQLGRVMNVIHGKDNKVRVAEIKTKNGIIKRSVVKLCLLPTNTHIQNKSPPK